MSEQFTNVMTEEEAAEMILNLFKPATVRKQVMKLIKKLDGTTYPVGLDVGVYCMWLAVAMYPEMLKEELRNFVPSVMDFDRIKALFLSGITVPSSPEAIARIGAEKIALQQMSYSGLGQMASGPQGGRAQINGGIASRWNVDGICKRIDLLSPLLKRVRITNLDFEMLLLDQRRSTVYLDPPYFDVGEKLYQHSLSHADHLRLSGLLRHSDHDWWLSMNDCQQVREVYSFAHIECIAVAYGTSNRRTHELLISSPRRNRTVFSLSPAELAA